MPLRSLRGDSRAVRLRRLPGKPEQLGEFGDAAAHVEIAADPHLSGGCETGASFRIVVDLADWDTAVGINTPGQAGDPDDPHYRDLFPLWANDRYFGVPFSRDRIAATGTTTLLLPR